MHAAKYRGRFAPPTSIPEHELRALQELVSAHADTLLSSLATDLTALLGENGTALLVTRADTADLPLLRHARPRDLEFGVIEEPDFPILTVVGTLGTTGGPRYVGFNVDVGSPETLRLFNLMISQPSVDVVFLDPDYRFAAAHRFELPLWSRAQAYRALAQAGRHLAAIPENRRSFERARESFQDYCTQNL